MSDRVLVTFSTSAGEELRLRLLIGEAILLQNSEGRVVRINDRPFQVVVAVVSMLRPPEWETGLRLELRGFWAEE